MRRVGQVALHATLAALSTRLDRKRKSGLLVPYEDTKRKDGYVHRAVDVADVVARTLPSDARDTFEERRRWSEKQRRQSIFAIAHRAPVHFEHVAKLHPPVARRGLHQQEIGFQLSALEDNPRRCGLPDDLLVRFFCNDARELLLELLDGRSSTFQDDFKRGTLRGSTLAHHGLSEVEGRADRAGREQHERTRDTEGICPADTRHQSPHRLMIA